MPVTKYYSIHPDIGKRAYSEISEQISPQAFYALDLMRRPSNSKRLTFEQIENMSLDARRFHTGALLKRCLLELEKANFLIVQERDTAEAE
jgi:hypothetical protein